MAADQIEKAPWDVTKERLKSEVLIASRGLWQKFTGAQPGEPIVTHSLTPHISFTARKEHRLKMNRDALLGLIFKITHGDEEVGYLELKPVGTSWDIPFRIVNEKFKGFGIFGALLAAAEQVVTECAESTRTPQVITVSSGQPSVFSVLEHYGYVVQDSDIDAAELLRHPEAHEDTVVVRRAVDMAATDPNFGDPFCFKREILEHNPKPASEDAVRVTLEKRIVPIAANVEAVSVATRPAVHGRLGEAGEQMA